MASSWLRSLFSPEKSLSSAQAIKSLSQRLRGYGFSLSRIFKLRGAEDEASNSLYGGLHIREEDNPLSVMYPDVRGVEGIIGYNFKNRDLLEEAFTHISYGDKCLSYDRLEYLGDSVLNHLITKELYLLYQSLPPGSLSPLRSANVDTEKLARAAVKNNLHRYLRYGHALGWKQIAEFVSLLPRYPSHSNGLIDVPKVLADIVESTIGAVYIDSNFSMDTTWEVTKFLLHPMTTPERLQVHPIQKLQELCQKHKVKLRVVDLWQKEGVYEVIVDNCHKGRGEGAKKEIAINIASNNAYKAFVKKMSIREMAEEK